MDLTNAKVSLTMNNKISTSYCEDCGDSCNCIVPVAKHSKNNSSTIRTIDCDNVSCDIAHPETYHHIKFIYPKTAADLSAIHTEKVIISTLCAPSSHCNHQYQFLNSYLTQKNITIALLDVTVSTELFDELREKLNLTVVPFTVLTSKDLRVESIIVGFEEREIINMIQNYILKY